jgi:hypothetical protein
MSDRISAAWREYRTKAIRLDAPAVQATECRRAFYAGAATMLTAILTMLEPGEEPTEKDLANMDALRGELVAFAEAVRAGRA